MSKTLVDTLIRHEGLRRFPYRDSVGKLTIGIGRNLDDMGLTEEEARCLLANDIRRVKDELNRCFPWIADLDRVRQEVLINMAFNLGLPRLCTFRNMLTALRDGDYLRAADEMLDSRWAEQVEGRAHELAEMMCRGEQ
ncbi:glycoside hydrolase family protein [Kistimonas asteriae]|uniref:glycoside hydrolase family protein n=1 Tax=Kistimonas asteriae TaxID=517724 RepID=UPI001BAD3CFA|nr:glycoside hydrolase family protein [Kistimonas asteriae]